MSDSFSVDDDVMLFAALSVLNDPVDQVLLIAVVALRKENILRAVGNTAPESDISGISSHNLDDTAALVGGGSITDFIDGFHRCVYSGIETDRIVGTGDIKVNGSRKTDRVDSESGKLSGTAEGTVSSDHNDTIDTMFLTYLSATLLALLSCELLTAGCVKDRTAAVDRVRNADAVHIYDFFLKESGVATHDSFYLQAFIDSGSYNRTDCRIHSRGISAAGQYSDRSDFFL